MHDTQQQSTGALAQGTSVYTGLAAARDRRQRRRPHILIGTIRSAQLDNSLFLPQGKFTAQRHNEHGKVFLVRMGLSVRCRRHCVLLCQEEHQR